MRTGMGTTEGLVGWGLVRLGLALLPMLAACGMKQPDTPLAVAAASGDLASVRDLLAAGADPDLRDGNGYAPLHYAARLGHLSVVKALLDAGASVDLPDHAVNAWTPLEHALHKNQAEAAIALLEGGADPNGRVGGTPPLLMAAGYGQTGLVRELLGRGADPYARRGGVNALWLAAGGGSVADITDGPPLGTCFPDTVRALRERAPDLKLPSGMPTRVVRWLSRSKECSELIRTLM